MTKTPTKRPARKAKPKAPVNVANIVADVLNEVGPTWFAPADPPRPLTLENITREI